MWTVLSFQLSSLKKSVTSVLQQKAVMDAACKALHSPGRDASDNLFRRNLLKTLTTLPGTRIVMAVCTALRMMLSRANIQWGLMLWFRSTLFTCTQKKRFYFYSSGVCAWLTEYSAYKTSQQLWIRAHQTKPWISLDASSFFYKNVCPVLARRGRQICMILKDYTTPFRNKKTTTCSEENLSLGFSHGVLQQLATDFPSNVLAKKLKYTDSYLSVVMWRQQSCLWISANK